MSTTGNEGGDRNWGSGGGEPGSQGDQTGQGQPPQQQPPGWGDPGGQQQWGQPPPPPQGQQWGQPPPGAQQWQTPSYRGGQEIPNYLVWSILTTVFCCQIFGIVSIVFAAQVNGKQAVGDIQGAMDASRKAKTWAIAAAASAVVGYIVIFGFVIVGGAMSTTGSG